VIAMKSDTIQNELEKLTKDKEQVDTRLIQLREEIRALEKNSDILSGAIQTCQYLLTLDEKDKSGTKKKTDTTSKIDALKSNV
tara:strand:+ start:69 stop:317 length:249 start_codon:yes stop_codon:yes gene_type:complete